uniref:Uncharacterized protein n=1 Tax=Picea glauca TaxID=3330 RepID=A0A101M5U9_PICGL|nr:hypothetical protein ABT39_MTgene1262 [Picea glauca]QHR88276.1 hypothetical protein Q903MT_gene2289 [Picea sitchensis]
MLQLAARPVILRCVQVVSAYRSRVQPPPVYLSYALLCTLPMPLISLSAPYPYRSLLNLSSFSIRKSKTLRCSHIHPCCPSPIVT